MSRRYLSSQELAAKMPQIARGIEAASEQYNVQISVVGWHDEETGVWGANISIMGDPEHVAHYYAMCEKKNQETGATVTRSVKPEEYETLSVLWDNALADEK